MNLDNRRSALSAKRSRRDTPQLAAGRVHLHDFAREPFLPCFTTRAFLDVILLQTLKMFLPGCCQFIDDFFLDLDS